MPNYYLMDKNSLIPVDTTVLLIYYDFEEFPEDMLYRLTQLEEFHCNGVELSSLPLYYFPSVHS